MGCLDLKTHLFEGKDDIAPRVLARVDGGQVKVAGLIIGLSCGPALRVPIKEIELRLRPNVETVAHPLRLCQGPL